MCYFVGVLKSILTNLDRIDSILPSKKGDFRLPHKHHLVVAHTVNHVKKRVKSNPKMERYYSVISKSLLAA